MISRILFYSLFIITIVGVIIQSRVTFFNKYFEVFIFLLLALNFFRINKKMLSVFILSIIYVLVSYVNAVVVKNAHILDFLLIYKFFIYVIPISFLTGKGIIEKSFFIKYFNFLVWAFILKYLISLFFFNDLRPILFHENNYELMFLSMLFYLKYVLKGYHSTVTDQFLLVAIFVLSGSRSALFILLFVLFIVNKKIILKKLHIIAPIAILLILLVIQVFIDRMYGNFDIMSIDRIRFFLLFLEETKTWGFIDYFIGANRITALSQETCNSLIWWDTLFSYSGNGTCYSVILHSFIFRVIFDHGFLGLFFMMYIIYRAITVSGFSSKNALTLTIIVLINGLSVSSFNSIYFIIGLVFFLVLKNDTQNFSNINQLKLKTK
jgi:hypothetical protein